jgi:hypothetical protein
MAAELVSSCGFQSSEILAETSSRHHPPFTLISLGYFQISSDTYGGAFQWF